MFYNFEPKKTNINKILLILMQNVAEIKNHNELIDFFVSKNIDVTIDSSLFVRSGYTVEGEKGEYKKTGLFSGLMRSQDDMKVGLNIVFSKFGIENVIVNISSDAYFFVQRKINKKFNEVLDFLNKEIGKPICGREFIPSWVNIFDGYTWFRSENNCHLNIFLKRGRYDMEFEFENVHPDDRMRSEFDTALLHLNRVLDSFDEVLILNPKFETLKKRRDSIENYIDDYVKSSDEKMGNALRGLVDKYKKKLNQ